jgi:tetratricopeptide (TPR) repeat protein
MSDTQQIQMYEEILSRARRERDQAQEAHALGSLGNLYAAQGNITKGIECLEKAGQIRESLHDYDGAALAYKNLAACYDMGLHDLPTTIRYLEKAANLASPNNPAKKTYAAMAAARREELNRQRR